jgi:flavin-dependent dehydrogenase
MGRAFDTDVFVIGGGPAGLAAAIAVRQQGMRVMVADCAHAPIDKACGEGLMPDSLNVLHQLGVSLQQSVTGCFSGIKFVGPDCSVAADFSSGSGVGIRRILLHKAFVNHAQACDVRMLWRARVSAISDGVVTVNGVNIRSRWVVGADGQNSQVRTWAGLSAGSLRARRIGTRQHFHISPWSDHVEIYWGRNGQAYVTPVANHEICVALISRVKYKSFTDGLTEFPALAERLRNAYCTTPERGALSVSRRLRHVYRNNIVLIGDASGSVDAVTGEGLALAFRQALALAPALAAGDLAPYATAHREICALPRFMSRSMLLMDQYQWIRSRALQALSQHPELFQKLLAVHVSEIARSDFGVSDLLNLGWEMLTA